MSFAEIVSPAGPNGRVQPMLPLSQQPPASQPPQEVPLRPTELRRPAGTLGSAVFDAVVLAALVLWFIGLYRRRRYEERFLRTSLLEQPPFGSSAALRTVTYPSEAEAEKLRKYINRWIQQFKLVQAAWNDRDLRPVSSMLAPDLLMQLQGELNQLEKQNLINHIEEVNVQMADTVDIWRETNHEFVTVHFRGTMRDYNTQRSKGSGVVVDEKSLEPVDFDEFWTFSRESEALDLAQHWLVNAIRRGDHGHALPRLASLY